MKKLAIKAREILVPPLSWKIPAEAIITAERLDAKFFALKKQQFLERMGNIWELTTLGSLCDQIFRGNAPHKPAYVSHGVPVLVTDSITGKGIDWDNVSFVPKEVYEKLREREVLVNDLIVASTGLGSIGKVDIIGFVPDKYEGVLTTPEITVVRIRKRKNPYYVLAFLRSPPGQVQVQSLPRGESGQLHLYPHDIANIMVPVLPLKEQKWIGEPLAKAEELRKEKFKLKEKLTEWEHEVFKEASPPKTFVISRKELEERLDARYYLSKQIARKLSKYKVVKLKKLLREPVRMGCTPPKKEYGRGGMPIVKVDNLTAEYQIDWNTISFVSDDFYRKALRARIHEHDILIPSAGMSLLQRRASIVHIPPEMDEIPLAVGELLIIRVNEELVNPYYITWLMTTDFWLMQISGLIRGSAQMHLYPRDLAEALIPYPPRDIQDEIGKLVKNIVKLRVQVDILQKEAEHRLIQLIIM